MHSFSSIQALEMRVLRTLYSHRHLLTNPTVKAKSFVCLNPFLKNSESTCRLVFYSSASVETVYDPISGRLVTRRHAVGSGGREQELESSSGVSGSENDAEDYEGGTVQWNLKEGELVNGSSNSSSWDGDFSEERVYATARKQTSPFRVTATSKKSKTSKKGKSKTYWVCSDCGHTEGQWWGTCRACEKVGTFKQFLVEEPNAGNTKATGFQVSDQVVQSWLPQRAGEERPVRITDVNRGLNHLDWRIPLNGRFGDEVSRVLGGGLVPGSLILVGGDPGVGKSTLLLQIGALISEGNDLGKAVPVVYVSGEESVEQICSRADRLKIVTDELYLYSSTDVEDFLQKSQALSPQALIVDSIQTAYLQEVTGSAGSITQIKECTSALLRFAKTTNIPVILIGHMTKSGEIAGPKVLEHIVDVVLYLEGEKSSSHRLLRSMKNRFGSTDELGVFEMSQLGLQPVTNPSQIYLSEEQSESEFLAGLAVAVIMDGSRSFLVEIQALCSRGLSVSRQVNGIQSGRVDMIISVLVKQAGLKLQENAIFVNVVSGLTLCETAADLAVAAAICSSFLEFPIPSGIAFIGEVGLGGELRSVPRMEKRVITLAQLGYRACIVPKSAENVLEVLDLGDMTIIACLNLKEVINAVFVA